MTAASTSRVSYPHGKLDKVTVVAISPAPDKGFYWIRFASPDDTQFAQANRVLKDLTMRYAIYCPKSPIGKAWRCSNHAINVLLRYVDDPHGLVKTARGDYFFPGVPGLTAA